MIVAVTGASGYLGYKLVRHLSGLDEVDLILAIDNRMPEYPIGPKTHFHLHDISLPLGNLLSNHNVDSVAHMAFQLHHGRNTDRAWAVNVRGSKNVATACDAASINRVVYLSSSTVYGAHPDNPPLLSETNPTRPIIGHSYAQHKVQSETIFRSFTKKRTGVITTILRSCPVLGPNADNFISRSLARPLLLKIAGHNPQMQLIHEDDITTAISKCVLSDSPGTYNLAGRGSISWDKIASELGRWKITLPAKFLYPVTETTWKLHLQSRSPSCGLDLIRYPWIVSTEKANLELGINSHYSTLETVESFVRRR